MTDKEFQVYLAQLRAGFRKSCTITEERPINYGYLFKVVSEGKQGSLAVYNGKKGLNHVWNGSQDLGAALGSLWLQEAAKSSGSGASGFASEAGFKGCWAGSDESGKGDFFGPLVVAAVVVDEATVAKLAIAGVKDCKLLTDRQILALEEKIKAAVVDFSVLELKPHIYNMRYKQVVAEGGKLNQLLGYGHVAALTQVLQRQSQCRQGLIDQFTTSNINLRQLKEKFPEGRFMQMPKAESDLAVAAASVLARARFLRSMEELAQRAGLRELPKGGGDATTACARAIAEKMGKAALGNFVKLHFANYGRI